jgi:hypothetical protein
MTPTSQNTVSAVPTPSEPAMTDETLDALIAEVRELRAEVEALRKGVK